MRHHEFSPSKLERIKNCPWSFKMCQGWKADDTADSSKGTILHEAIHSDEALSQLSEKDRELIQFIRKEHVEPYKNMECYSELLVSVFGSDNKADLLTFGYLDFLVIAGDKASIKDWKFGGYEVTPAQENIQIKTYVAGVFQRFTNVNTIFAMIVQPIYGTTNYDKQAVFTRDQLPEILAEIRAIQEKAHAAVEADAVTSAENCRYCNKYMCKAYRARMEMNFTMVGVDSSHLTLSEQEESVEYADRILMAEKEITAAMEKKTAFAKKIILDAGGSENFRVATGRVSRKTDWKSVAEEANVDPYIIEKHTVESVGSPYVSPRMRKTTKKLNA